VDTLASCENYLKREKNRTEVTEGDWMDRRKLVDEQPWLPCEDYVRKEGVAHGTREGEISPRLLHLLNFPLRLPAPVSCSSLPRLRGAADLAMDPDAFQDAEGEQHQHQK
jgi:hypothetical protein